METKICQKCKQELPYVAFSTAKQSLTGCLNTCKKCRGAFQNTPDTLECPVCKRILPWYAYKPAANSKNGVSWACAECIDNRPEGMSATVFRQKYDEDFHQSVLKSKREEERRHHVKYMLNRARRRAAKNNLDFNLDLEDIVIPEICPILEVPLVIGEKDDYEYTPSIDRIDNSKGYIKGNIQIISKKANSMKNSATIDELKAFCKNVLRYSLNTAEYEGSEPKDKEPQG